MILLVAVGNGVVATDAEDSKRDERKKVLGLCPNYLKENLGPPRYQR